MREILGRGPHLKIALDIATCHHEKWNGTGYPKKLSGRDIPLSARLAAIIDVFDALSSKRPYKDRMSTEFALLEIERNIGTQFDPVLARVFVNLVRTGKMPVL
jgi:response regulator RpfG family c-di-GMP phosphodiesterase